MKRFLFLFGFLLTSLIVSAQSDSFESEILRMLQIKGSSANTDFMFYRVVSLFKAAKPDIAEAKWAALKKEVFDPAMAELNKLLVPVYKKLYTPEEVKSIISFYETPAERLLLPGTARRCGHKVGISPSSTGPLCG